MSANKSADGRIAIEKAVDDAWWAWQASRPDGPNPDLARQALNLVGDWLAARRAAREAGYREGLVSEATLAALRIWLQRERGCSVGDVACESVCRDLADVLKEPT